MLFLGYDDTLGGCVDWKVPRKQLGVPISETDPKMNDSGRAIPPGSSLDYTKSLFSNDTTYILSIDMPSTKNSPT